MLGSILKCLLGGRWKTAIFSVTSACNCRCSMCNVPNLPPQHILPNTAFESDGGILMNLADEPRDGTPIILTASAIEMRSSHERR